MTYFDLISDAALSTALEKQGIITPTHIQEQSYEKMKEGIDIIARSETGSGKTLAYLIPAIQRLESDRHTNQILILVPTHELAIQVHRQTQLLAKNSGIPITSTVIIGNGNISRQIDALKEKPFIVIGTAGRILELIKKRKISAHTIKTLIIDEADKLLDKDNLEAVMAVRKCLMRDIQVALFSASLNNNALTKAQQLSKNATVLTLTEKNVIPDNIEHFYIMVPSKREKINTLRSLCSALHRKHALIFINTQYDINQAHERLAYHQYKIGALCGSADKNQRRNSIEAFKSGKLQYLIATDIASRGIHIDGVETVINVTVPENPLDYLHRAGRCGRGLSYGQCISIITPSELKKIKTYQSEFKITFKEKKLERGQIC